MKNIFFAFCSIFIFFIIFFGSLNFILGGVPLFNIFKIDLSDLVFALKKKELGELNKIDFNKEHYIHKCGYSEDGFNNLAYKKDNFGFRENRTDLFYDTDIVILGDSFGASHCINKPNDLTSLLINLTGNKKVLNISVSGTGPYYQKEMIISLFTQNKTNFNTFIWLFYEGNDHEELRNYFGKKFDFKFDNDKNKNIQISDQTKVNYVSKVNPTILKFKFFLANYSRGFGTLIKYFKTYPTLIKNEEIYDSTVNDLNNFLIEKNINNKIIFYIPKYTRLSYNKIKHPQIKQLDNLKKLIEKTAHKYNFKFIDGSSIYWNRTDPLDVFHYNLPTHFNLNGYSILAKEISTVIKN